MLTFALCAWAMSGIALMLARRRAALIRVRIEGRGAGRLRDPQVARATDDRRWREPQRPWG